MSRRRAIRVATTAVLLLIASVAAKVAPNKPLPAAMPAQGNYLAVEQIYDGDTIAVRINGTLEKVRLLGIDTPETHDPRKPVQCFGREASDWSHSALTGRRVRLQSDPGQGERDKYDRLLAYVWRDDGVFINESLVKEGYAHEYTYQTPYQYQALFRTDEQQAREQQKGLWAPNTCNGDTKQAAK